MNYIVIFAFGVLVFIVLVGRVVNHLIQTQSSANKRLNTNHESTNGHLSRSNSVIFAIQIESDPLNRISCDGFLLNVNSHNYSHKMLQLDLDKYELPRYEDYAKFPTPVSYANYVEPKRTSLVEHSNANTIPISGSWFHHIYGGPAVRSKFFVTFYNFVFDESLKNLNFELNFDFTSN